LERTPTAKLVAGLPAKLLTSATRKSMTNSTIWAS
jgi:hypothetical protein